MKKLLLFSVFALLFSLLSCTTDEYENQSKQETKKTVDVSKDTYADGPGDGGPIKPPPPGDE